MRVYATTDDLTTWTGQAAPSNAASLLRSASILIESMTATAFYSTDNEGYPTSATISGVFQDATCSQAAFWASNGLDPAKGAVAVAGERVATSKSIDGASLSYESGQAGREARTAALHTLSPEAHSILDRVGLLDHPPVNL